MAVLTNEDVKWYVATRKDSGAHVVRNERYIEVYEREYERIREFDTIEEATEAYEIRVAADDKLKPNDDKSTIRAAKIRGDIKSGSREDEELRAKIKAEIEEEQKAAKPPSSRGAKMGPKTAAKTSASKPTKDKLE
jgi:hypothetical protein